MTDVAAWVKDFRRDVPRPERESILGQYQSLTDVVSQIAAVPAPARPSLYLPALWTLAAKYLEAPDATTPAEREGLLRQLSELCAMPYGELARDMREMVGTLDFDHRAWKKRRRRNPVRRLATRQRKSSAESSAVVA